MSKKGRFILLLGVFVFLAPTVLLAAVFSLSYLDKGSTRSNNNFTFTSFTKNKTESLRLYKALPPRGGHLSFSVATADARPVIIADYLRRYNSPLLPYAEDIFNISQKYDLDYRLLVAIAQQESNLGKKIPAESFNAWGWGIHSRGTLRFTSWPEAIEAVAKGLRKDYLNKGYQTPEEIMAKYTPLSNGSWAFGVNQFMSEME